MGRKNEREGKSESALVEASRRRSCSPANVCFAELHSLHTTCLPLRVEPLTGERDKHPPHSDFSFFCFFKTFAWFSRQLAHRQENSVCQCSCISFGSKRTSPTSSLYFPLTTILWLPLPCQILQVFLQIFFVLYTSLSFTNLGAGLCFVQTNM